MRTSNLYEVSAALYAPDGAPVSGMGVSIAVVSSSFEEAMAAGMQFIKERDARIERANPIEAVSLEGNDPISAEIRRASLQREKESEAEWRPFKVEQMLEGRRVLVA